MTKKAYIELEGKEIIFTYTPYKQKHVKKIDAVVAGCERDIGIAIMDREKKNYHICLKYYNAPSYHQIFDRIAQSIKRGKISLNGIIKFIKHIKQSQRIGGNASVESCPFSQ